MNTILLRNLCRSSRNLLYKIEKNAVCSYQNLHISPVSILRVPASPTLSCSRNFWETFPSSRRLLHLKDGLDRDTHEIIFRAKLFNYAFYAQLASLSTFAVQTLFGLHYAYQAIVYQEGPTMTTVFGLPVTYDLGSVMILTILTLYNVLVYQIAQRVLLRVYHKVDTDEYVFVSLDTNPFKSRLTYCKPGELVPLFKENRRSFLGNFRIGDRKFFLRYENFPDIHHFNRLLSESYTPKD